MMSDDLTKLAPPADEIDSAATAPAPPPAGRGVTAGGWPYVQPDDHPLQYPAVSQSLAEMLDTLVPLGTVVSFGGTIAPAGWHLCNGTAHGSAGLKAVIGTDNTPDLRGLFIVGAGGTYAVGATGGANSVTLTTAQLPAHTHRLMDPNNNAEFGMSPVEPDTDNGIPGVQGVVRSVNPGTIRTDSGPGTSAGHENRPPYYALTYIIRKGLT